MPAVAPNHDLKDALAAYLALTGHTKSHAAETFGVDPMTLARFLKTGRGLDATRNKLEAGLTQAGYWSPQETPPASPGSVPIISNDKVIAALEFLLAAARQHDGQSKEASSA